MKLRTFLCCVSLALSCDDIQLDSLSTVQLFHGTSVKPRSGNITVLKLSLPVWLIRKFYPTMGASRRKNRQTTSGSQANDPSIRSNAAACADTENSKHMDAAALALNLASGSRWSDAFSTPSPSIRENMNGDSTSAQGFEYTRNHVVVEDTALEPPPPYFFTHEQDLDRDETTPDPENTHQPSTQQESTASDNPDYAVRESLYEDNLRALLMNEPSEKSAGGWYPWMQVNNSASSEMHRSWRLCVAIGLVTVLILGGILRFLHVCFTVDD